MPYSDAPSDRDPRPNARMRRVKRCSRRREDTDLPPDDIEATGVPGPPTKPCQATRFSTGGVLRAESAEVDAAHVGGGGVLHGARGFHGTYLAGTGTPVLTRPRPAGLPRRPPERGAAAARTRVRCRALAVTWRWRRPPHQLVPA